MTALTHAQELAQGERFAFGENWSRFLRTLDDDRIRIAEHSLKNMLQMESLAGMRFVDAGSGSGLFSLAARRLGAEVHSFDFDPQSVACTTELRRRYFPDDSRWTVEEGSVLDRDFLRTVGRADIVYSWGVLHHTGRMWDAIANVTELCAEDGLLFISIYNYTGGASRRWTWVKKTYCRLPRPAKLPFALAIVAPFLLYSLAAYTAGGRPLAFFRDKIQYRTQRGMSWWHDQIDWIGGYPYEDAKPEEVFRFVQDRGFRLLNLVTCGGGIGCNEFLFRRTRL